MKIQILDKTWKLIRSGPYKDRYGDCDAPDTPHPKIRIDKTLVGRKELEIILHELLHAADWHKDETWVAQVSKDLSVALDKIGYKKDAQD